MSPPADAPDPSATADPAPGPEETPSDVGTPTPSPGLDPSPEPTAVGSSSGEASSAPPTPAEPEPAPPSESGEPVTQPAAPTPSPTPEVPVAEAAAVEVSLSAFTAGTKPARLATSIWGWVEPASSSPVSVEVRTGDTWTAFAETTPDATGFYAAELTWGQGSVGVFTFRTATDVGGERVTSPEVPLVRTRHVSVASAGTKPVGQGTNAWGWVSGSDVTHVSTEVRLGETWSRSQIREVRDDGWYVIPLTYGLTMAGDFRYRVRASFADGTSVVSGEFTIRRAAVVTAYTAGVKLVGVTTNTWGTVRGFGNGRVWTEVWLDGAWSRSQVRTSDTSGYFVIPLTYGWMTPGWYRFRVGADTPVGRAYSPEFQIQRVAWQASIRATTLSDVRYTYREGCPVGPSGLATIAMTYRDYAGALVTGEMVVRRDLAAAVTAAFRDAFDGGFRIAQMRNPDHWRADDVVMMAANNTSAFNCRHVVGNPYRMSPHSYGHAIDINPVQNPYRAPDGTWYPTSTYSVSRPSGVTGMLYRNGPMVTALTGRGWEWFSGWDWHHFER